MKTAKSPYHGDRFPSKIRTHSIWLYHRFCQSLRDVEDLLAELGVVVSYESIRQWCSKFGPHYAKGLKRRHTQAARRISRKLLKGQEAPPRRMITDKLKSCSAARREVMPSVTHRTAQDENDRAEVSHEPTRVRERYMRRFKSARRNDFSRSMERWAICFAWAGI